MENEFMNDAFATYAFILSLQSVIACMIGVQRSDMFIVETFNTEVFVVEE